MLPVYSGSVKDLISQNRKTRKQRLESLASLFSKSYVCKMSQSVLTETRSFKILQVQKHTFFEDGPFSWRISVDGRPNHRNKAAFSNISIHVSVNGASAVPTARASNLDFSQLFPSYRVAKAELATRKICETSRKVDRFIQKSLNARFIVPNLVNKRSCMRICGKPKERCNCFQRNACQRVASLAYTSRFNMWKRKVWDPIFSWIFNGILAYLLHCGR